ncbi:TetR/AcrR family transcriptional regulator [Actinomycetaceae bacterium L2_0104]
MGTPHSKGIRSAIKPAAKRDPKGNKQAIMDAALEEFARYGFGGSRIDEIARDTNTSKRMIYYYFGNKRGLHRAVVLDAVKSVQFLTNNLRTHYDDPVHEFAVRVDAALTWAEENPLKLRLLTTENQYPDGESELIEGVNADISAAIVGYFREPFAYGQSLGSIRSGPDAPSIMEVYQVAISLALMRIEHHFSMKTLHGHDIFSASSRLDQHGLIIETLLRLIVVEPSQAERYVQQVLTDSQPPENPKWPEDLV